MDFDSTEIPEDWDILSLAAEKLEEISADYPAKWQKQMIDVACELTRLAQFVESEALGTQPCLQDQQPSSVGVIPLHQCPTDGAQVVAFEPTLPTQQHVSATLRNSAEPSEKTGTSK